MATDDQSAPLDPERPVCVLQITDPHVTREGRCAYRVVDTAARLTEAVEAAVAWEAENGPADLIIVTGDLAHFGRGEEYARFREAMAPLEGRYRVIPGNHDNRAAMRRAFPDHAYLQKPGALDWSVALPGLRVVGLDSLVEGTACGMLGVETLSFLAKEIAEADGAPMLVALHHPPFETGIEDIDRDGLENAGELKEVLALHRGPLQVIAGHAHRMAHAPKPLRGQKPFPGAPFAAPPCFPALVRNYKPHAGQSFIAAPGGFMAHFFSSEDGFEADLVEVGALTGELPRFS